MNIKRHKSFFISKSEIDKKKRDKMFSKIRVFIECIRTVYSKYVALAITTLWGSTRNLPLTKTENVSKPKISPEQFPLKI